jgi:hypothetical protein
VTYLRKLMGDKWVDAEVFGANPTHPLGRWQKHDPNNPWLPHVDRLVKAMLTDGHIKCVAKDLRRKLNAEYVSTLAEMESAVFLAGQGFAVTVEPTAPKRGPDLLAEWNGVSYFVEIREAGLSWDEDRINLISKKVFTDLSTVPSSYTLDITVGEAYTAKSPRLKAAMGVVVESLKLLKERNLGRATLYYAHPDGRLLNPGGDAGHMFSGAQARYQEIVDKADFIGRFRNVGKERSGTPATLSRKLKNPPQPVNTHERLKNILIDKCGQIPKESRGIIILEVSEQFMLSDFTILGALYGDLEIQFPPVSGPGAPVGEMTVKSNERGFFGQTARVSAVVIQKRTVDTAQIKSSREVYPTNRANPDTIRLTLAELERFGDVGDRKHLAEENARKVK